MNHTRGAAGQGDLRGLNQFQAALKSRFSPKSHSSRLHGRLGPATLIVHIVGVPGLSLDCEHLAPSHPDLPMIYVYF